MSSIPSRHFRDQSSSVFCRLHVREVCGLLFIASYELAQEYLTIRPSQSALTSQYADVVFCALYVASINNLGCFEVGILDIYYQHKPEGH